MTERSGPEQRLIADYVRPEGMALGCQCAIGEPCGYHPKPAQADELVRFTTWVRADWVECNRCSALVVASEESRLNHVRWHELNDGPECGS